MFSCRFHEIYFPAYEIQSERTDDYTSRRPLQVGERDFIVLSVYKYAYAFPPKGGTNRRRRKLSFRNRKIEKDLKFNVTFKTSVKIAELSKYLPASVNNGTFLNYCKYRKNC